MLSRRLEFDLTFALPPPVFAEQQVAELLAEGGDRA